MNDEPLVEITYTKPPLFFGYVCYAIVTIAIAIWAFRDARRRGYSGWAIALMVTFVPAPVGLIAWIATRPDVLDRASDLSKG